MLAPLVIVPFVATPDSQDGDNIIAHPGGGKQRRQQQRLKPCWFRIKSSFGRTIIGQGEGEEQQTELEPITVVGCNGLRRETILELAL